jgi:hypothetical protein
MLGGCAAVGVRERPQTRFRAVLVGGSMSSWRLLLWSKMMQTLGERATDGSFARPCEICLGPEDEEKNSPAS